MTTRPSASTPPWPSWRTRTPASTPWGLSWAGPATASRSPPTRSGVRAALAWSLPTAKLAREHNDANVVAVGGRQHSVDEATGIIEAFLTEPFSHDERHVRRIGKIARYEATGEVVE